ncbi:reverse transcriptase [Lasius niger]|uniref:Reverse transcriptase n=1 Tax=Lasius niger TaxID=67767 RepID=A0A0J7KLC8_LASNI|nr:reverse transcriptase [Lasius niger]
MIRWLDRIMQEACDAATNRIGPRKPRRQVYWWQDSVATLRDNCVRARRLWQRAKRRKRRNQEEIDNLDSIDSDPWGLPYRLIIKKLKAATPSMIELLDPDVLSDLLDSLFPRNNRPDPLTDWSEFEWSEDWAISPNEVTSVITKKSASAAKAPGPDGFALTLWKKALAKILEWMRTIFNECLKSGVFPATWKRANLALIPKASHIICYADDTMIVVTGPDLLHTKVRASLLANRVIGQIQSIKYLGVFIDSKWSFSDHFRYVDDKAGRVIRALNRLMPNLRGPDEKQRRLYANAIMSVILYGARTVSGNAAFLLARMPPLRFLAPARKRVYEQVKRLKDDGDYTKGRRDEIKVAEHERMLEEWRVYLERPNRPGEYTKMAIVPWLEAWMGREHGSLSLHLAQLMTGHGCFAKYLC